MSDKATPKQIAYLTYMGVSGVEHMTKKEVSEIFEKLDATRDTDEWLIIQSRRSEWITDRFLLYPDLYASEFNRYLNDELPEVLHTYVRGQVVGSSEKLTKSKIQNVIQTMTSENPAWWKSPQRKELFFESLRQTYPGCCDGHPPVKTQKRPTPRRLPDPDVAMVASTPSAKNSGCLVVLAIPPILFLIYIFFRRIA